MDRKNDDLSSSGVQDALNDSWFGRNGRSTAGANEIRAIAAELRARLSRAYRTEDGSVALGAVAHPGLDDSWFK